MEKLPKEVVSQIVEYSIEKKNKSKENVKPEEFLILYYNINPFRALCHEYFDEYKTNPPPTVLQLPICSLS